jgi:hypothetical protein
LYNLTTQAECMSQAETHLHQWMPVWCHRVRVFASFQPPLVEWSFTHNNETHWTNATWLDGLVPAELHVYVEQVPPYALTVLVGGDQDPSLVYATCRPWFYIALAVFLLGFFVQVVLSWSLRRLYKELADLHPGPVEGCWVKHTRPRMMLDCDTAEQNVL